MLKIFLIGKGTFKKEYKDALTAKGNTIKMFESLDTVLPRFNENPDLLILDKIESKEPAFKEFLKQSRNIPKIIISDTNSGLTSLIKEPFTYPICSPSVKELSYLVNRSLKERKMFLQNDRLKGDSSLLSRELEIYEEVNKDLASSIDLNSILDTVMKRAKKLTRAETWTVFLVDEGTGELVFERTEGKKTKETQKFRLMMGEGIAGWVAKGGKPVLVPDVSQDKRFSKKIDSAFNLKHKIKSIMCVPIKSNEKPLGVIEVFNKTTGEPFTREDFNQLIKLIDQSSILIERALLYQKVEELSITDDLTKLFNTRYLNRTIEMEIQRSLRYRTSVSLIFMDIDDFKQINDRHGHLVGSKILAEMGQLLIRNLRSVDVVVRYGGDEFVIVLPHTPPAAAALIAERIRKSVERNVFLEKEGYTLRTTASFGVASYPESARSKEELLRLADEAMYKVKYHTKNGVHAII
jgi:diguanylate cyclase (GGDEF)-like protein